MSTTDRVVEVAGSSGVLGGGDEVTLARTSKVGSIEVRRFLPLQARRNVGSWCFVDHYGPLSVDGLANMHVAPHPHMGLQTVTWLFSGEVLHLDSLGSEQVIRPGELNLMTAGHGIAHAELSMAEHDRTLHGLQLWLALPASSREGRPDFVHHSSLPCEDEGGLVRTVFVGSLGRLCSPAQAFWEVVGAQVSCVTNVTATLELDSRFEHVLIVVSGRPYLDGRLAEPQTMRYLAPSRQGIEVRAEKGTHMVLLGGTPLFEPILMWWNFVARSHEEVVQATADWSAGERFGVVGAYRGARLSAPAVPSSPLSPR